jgi:hypothetical protein
VLPGDDASTIRTLRIVYKAILGVVALIIFIGVLIFGMKIWIKIRSSTVSTAVRCPSSLACSPLSLARSLSRTCELLCVCVCVCVFWSHLSLLLSLSLSLVFWYSVSHCDRSLSIASGTPGC